MKASPRLCVAMIIQSYYPRVGGAERQLARLAPLLTERGVDLHILTRRYPGMKSFEIIEDVPVHRMPVPGPKPLAAMSFTLAALPLLRRLKPDVIHAHELLSPATTAVTAKRLLGVPVAAKVLRGGHLGDLAKLSRSPMGEQRIETLRREVDAFIVISQEIDSELASVGVAPERRIFIPNGVDTGHFSPVSAPAGSRRRAGLGLPEGLMVLFTGRFVQEKRLDQLIGMWPQIRQAFPQAYLVLVGEGDQHQALESQAAGLLEQAVFIRPPVEDVTPYLQAADIFVLPSATEGLSNALLEAMSAGLAVIATQVGGAPDVIQPDVNGLLVPPDQPERLQEALRGLLADPALRQSLGSAARLRIQQAYSLPAAADSLRDLYEYLVVGVDETVYSGRG